MPQQPPKQKKRKQRLDSLLVERQLCDSRSLAQRWIRAGDVKVEQQIIDKPGTEVARSAAIEIRARSPYVSRGGEKLAKALDHFGVDPRDRICLDGGISTGGFTDCLLQRGARRVYGIDVGYGQVAWSLRTDERLVLKERVNLRHLQPEQLYGVAAANPSCADLDAQPGPNPGADLDLWPDLGVVDVSFISLVKVLPALQRLLSGKRELLLLVKPQFEVGRDKVGKKGVVREAKLQAEAVEQVLGAARELGWGDRGLTWSPITGPAGNIEYLLWLSQREAETEAVFCELEGAQIQAIAQKAHQSLS